MITNKIHLYPAPILHTCDWECLRKSAYLDFMNKYEEPVDALMTAKGFTDKIWNRSVNLDIFLGLMPTRIHSKQATITHINLFTHTHTHTHADLCTRVYVHTTGIVYNLLLNETVLLFVPTYIIFFSDVNKLGKLHWIKMGWSDCLEKKYSKFWSWAGIKQEPPVKSRWYATIAINHSLHTYLKIFSSRQSSCVYYFMFLTLGEVFSSHSCSFPRVCVTAVLHRSLGLFKVYKLIFTI